MPPLLHSNVSSFHSSRHASSPCFLAAPPAAHRFLSCTNRLSISRILPFRLCNRTFCCLHIQSLIAQQMPDRTPAYWSWLSPELPEMDELRGWSDVYSSDHALLQGAGLNIGAGVVLAISLSVASFLVFSKTGRLYQSFRSVTQEAHLHVCPTGVSPESEEEVKTRNMEKNISKEGGYFLPEKWHVSVSTKMLH